MIIYELLPRLMIFLGGVSCVTRHRSTGMHLSGAVGRQESSVVGLHDGLHDMLSVLGSLHVRHYYELVVFVADDTSSPVLHAVLLHQRGHKPHTVAVGQRSISNQVTKFRFWVELIDTNSHMVVGGFFGVSEYDFSSWKNIRKAVSRGKLLDLILRVKSINLSVQKK